VGVGAPGNSIINPVALTLESSNFPFHIVSDCEAMILIFKVSNALILNLLLIYAIIKKEL
jgi:hypothetical protein